MLQLRPYQQEAFDSAMEYLRKSYEPCVIEAATGAGKSLLVSEIAKWLNEQSGKKVLCLAPSKELVEQNREKYLATGNPAGVWCASVGKSMKHPVIFGSPQSIKNEAEKFSRGFAGVIIDEAHGMTPTVKTIVKRLRKGNPRIRIIGLSATPYRTGEGYIYKYDEKDKPVNPDGYFHKLLYRITAWELINLGFLTPPTSEVTGVHYDTSQLEKNNMGKFTSESVGKTFQGHERKTAAIVKDIVNRSHGREGVMIFAATIDHAKEVMASLPPSKELVTGGTPRRERESIIKRFKEKQFKYIVNVACLTTGFDSPHVSVVAVLRATESPGLFQQIIGRGLRLAEGKKDCLVLDYAENVERHCPEGDIFDPQIKQYKQKKEGQQISAECKICGFENEFTARENPDGYKINNHGYFQDLQGNELQMPAHYGRRCQGYSMIAGKAHQCHERWMGKECPKCKFQNDIAARRCENCKEEIIDPNEKLRINFAKVQKDPYTPTADKVLSWHYQPYTTKSGKPSIVVTWRTEHRSFKVWYMPSRKRQWQHFCLATMGKITDIANFKNPTMPKTITSYKKRDTNFYEVVNYNEVPKEPESLRRPNIQGAMSQRNSGASHVL